MTIALDTDDLVLTFTALHLLDDRADAEAGAPGRNDAPPPALPRLLGEIDIADVWERHPVRATGLGRFDDVFSVDTVDHLMSWGGLRDPAFRMMFRGTNIPSARYTRESVAPKPIEGFLDPVKVNQLFANGATLVLRGLRRHSESVDRFSGRLGAELGHAVHANAYLTPAGSTGAGPHWDNHSVFIRQVAGAKRWTVREPVEVWPRRTSTPDAARDTLLVGEWVLEEGDCLYIPRGFIHSGEALPEAPSAHITFGLLDPTTWTDLMVGVINEFAEDERWREILPPRFADRPDVVAQALADHRDLLVQRLRDLDVPAAARRLIAEQDVSPERTPHRFRSLMTTVEPITVLRAAEGARLVEPATRDGALVCEAPFGSLRCPSSLVGLLRELLDGAPHPASIAFAQLTEQSARVVLRRLLQCGALVVA